jgi:hypothetical protein
VGLTNLGSESKTCVGSRIRLVGVFISFEKNFYRLPFTPPSLVRRIGPSFCPPEWLIVILGWKGNERPVKGMERVPYGPKTNGNLIRCQLQIFRKYPGGFEKVDPGAENRVLAHENGPKRTFFVKS